MVWGAFWHCAFEVLTVKRIVWNQWPLCSHFICLAMTITAVTNDESLDWLENLQRKPRFLGVFTIKYELSCKLSLAILDISWSHEPAGNGSDQARVAKCGQGEIRKNDLRSTKCTKGYRDSERMWVQTITAQKSSCFEHVYTCLAEVLIGWTKPRETLRWN